MHVTTTPTEALERAVLNGFAARCIFIEHASPVSPPPKALKTAHQKRQNHPNRRGKMQRTGVGASTFHNQK
jgi:hypothetical protein